MMGSGAIWNDSRKSCHGRLDCPKKGVYNNLRSAYPEDCFECPRDEIVSSAPVLIVPRESHCIETEFTETRPATSHEVLGFVSVFC